MAADVSVSQLVSQNLSHIKLKPSARLDFFFGNMSELTLKDFLLLQIDESLAARCTIYSQFIIHVSMFAHLCVLRQLVKRAKQDNQQNVQIIPVWHKNSAKTRTYSDKRKCRRRQEEGLSIQSDLPRSVITAVCCVCVHSPARRFVRIT